MIDVNKITSTLAKLPDTQLQQYAQMHKTDPYIMALAMSESNRRKVVRSAGQGAQGMQAQPKVVDSEIAQMAPQPAQAMPEDQGIGQLPAGNMNFAGGGIIAFADGGDVERYQAGGMPYDPYAYGFSPLSAEQQDALKARAKPPQLTSMTRDIVAQAKFKQMNGLPLLPEERVALQSPTTPEIPAAAPKVTPTYSPDDYSGMDRRITSGSQQPSIPSITPFAAKAAPTADAAPTARAATPGVAMPSYAGLDPAAMFRKEMELAGKQPDPYATERKEIGEAKIKAKEEEVTGIEAIQQKFDNIFKGRKERLDTKEGEIAKMGDQSLGLALLQAGAAMMTTPGGVGVALGKGIDVGSKQYVAGLDKLNAAKDKLSDARDRLEEVEAQRGELSARELFKARNEVKNAQIGAKEDMVKALMQRDNINRETALKMVDGQIKIGLSQLEQQGATARTGAQIAAANRTPAEIQMIERIMAEKKIPFSEALAYVSGAKREGVSEEKLRGEWLDSNKRMQIAQDYPNVKSFEDYKTVMGMGGAGGGNGFKVVGVRQSP